MQTVLRLFRSDLLPRCRKKEMMDITMSDFGADMVKEERKFDVVEFVDGHFSTVLREMTGEQR